MGNLLDGKHALVTGGSSGIGKAIAEELEKQGATIYIFDKMPSGRAWWNQGYDLSPLQCPIPSKAESRFRFFI